MFNHLNEEIQKVARLTKENERLRGEIQRPGENVATTLNGNHANFDNLTTLQEDLRLLTDKHEELTRKYQDVSQKARYMERKNQTVMQKNKDMKESVRAWQEYADRQSGKPKPKTETRGEDAHTQQTSAYHPQGNRPHVPSSPGSIATARTPATPADPGRSSPAPMAPLPQLATESAEHIIGHSNTPRNTHRMHRHSRGSTTPKPKHQTHCEESYGGVDYVSRFSPTHAHLQPCNPTSSQTTVDELAERPGGLANDMEAEDNGDAPQFVSERSLKRKRGHVSKPRFEIFADPSSDGTPAKPYKVKEESHSSPPTSVSTVLLRKETFDLDELAPSILKTPRHRRNYGSNHASSTGTLRHPRSNSAPFSQNIKREDAEPRNLAEVDTSNVLKSCERGSGLHLATTEDRAFSEPSGSTQPEQAILRSIDPNLPSSISEDSPHKRRKRRSGRPRVVAHDMLAESGEASLHVDDELRLPPNPDRAQLNHKRHATKNSQTPMRRSLQTPKSEPTKTKVEEVLTPSTNLSRSKQTPHTTGQTSRATPRDDATLGERQVWIMKAPDSHTGARKARPALPQRQGRLRDRRPTELSAQDFKPNPAYNQGYSYAFSETVRKRGDRMCLPGCTNLHCCGSAFRTFAEAQAPLPASQEEALLADYLGEAYSNMHLTQMSCEERQELVLQARTKKMAKESGKHREAYERRKTPPGFWRVDFPSTQEQQQDRAKAQEMERREVQGRWLEAQRTGGRWVFRDE